MANSAPPTAAGCAPSGCRRRRARCAPRSSARAPAPLPAGLDVTKGSNRCGSTSAAMSGPVLRTAIRQRPPRACAIDLDAPRRGCRPAHRSHCRAGCQHLLEADLRRRRPAGPAGSISTFTLDAGLADPLGQQRQRFVDRLAHRYRRRGWFDLWAKTFSWLVRRPRRSTSRPMRDRLACASSIAAALDQLHRRCRTACAARPAAG